MLIPRRCSPPDDNGPEPVRRVDEYRALVDYNLKVVMRRPMPRSLEHVLQI